MQDKVNWAVWDEKVTYFSLNTTTLPRFLRKQSLGPNSPALSGVETSEQREGKNTSEAG